MSNVTSTVSAHFYPEHNGLNVTFQWLLSDRVVETVMEVAKRVELILKVTSRAVFPVSGVRSECVLTFAFTGS